MAKQSFGGPFDNRQEVNDPNVPIGDITGMTDTLVAFGAPDGSITQDAAFNFVSGTGVLSVPTVGGGSGSGGDLTLSSTTNGTKGTIIFGSVSAYDEANDRLSLGGLENTITIGGVSTGAKFSTHTEGATDLIDNAAHRHSDTAAFGSAVALTRSRGSEASETVVQSGDVISRINSYGHDGTDYELAAQIDVDVDGTPGAGDMPGRIRMSTTPSGTATPVEAMRIDNDQNVYASNRVKIGGDVSIAPTIALEIAGTTGASSRLSFTRWSAGSAGTQLRIRHARGTEALPTAVLSGDELSNIVSQGYDSTGFKIGSQLQAQATENWTASAHGSNMIFKTQPNGVATGSVQALVIDNDQSATFEGGVISTIADTKSAVGLTVNQNDTTNNPIGVSILNTGTGDSLRVNTNDFIIDGSGNTSIGNRLLESKGADVASATDITLGNDGNYFDITGTTQIDTISATDWTAGSLITLQFDASVTIAHNTAGTGASILLSASISFAATVNDTLSLRYDGVTWREVGRSSI